MNDRRVVVLRFYPPCTWWEHLISIGGRRLTFVHVDAAWRVAGGTDVVVTDSAPFRGVRVSVGRLPLFVAGCECAALPVSGPVDEWVQARVGERYGWLDCAQAFVRRWTGLNIGGNPRGEECAEYVATLLNDNGYGVSDTRSRTPDDLAVEIGIL